MLSLKSKAGRHLHGLGVTDQGCPKPILDFAKLSVSPYFARFWFRLPVFCLVSPVFA